MSYDTDAQAYFTAVESADTQALETGVKNAINAFVVGCKADGIWSSIKAACIMAGARTRLGAMTPLVGPAPTSFNFVDADYDRKTGLIGNGSTKYLNTNRNNNADPQNSNHNALYIHSAGSAGFVAMGAGGGANGANTLGTGGGTRSRNANLDTSISSPTGFFAMSRSNGSDFSIRAGGNNLPKTRVSETPNNNNVFIFATSTPASSSYSFGRYSFYSIGESLDLALLDARLTTLMAALGDDATYSTLRRNHAFIGVAF